jgi:glutathione S-transferase
MRGRNDPEQQKKNHQNIKEKLMFIETECFQKNKDGLFWMGEQISLVDLHYAPFFERFGAYEHLFNAQWPEECTQLTAWWSAMQQRESYKSTFLPLESHIETYSEMMQRIA